MADITKSYVDLTQLSYYNGKIKNWANSENQVAFKTVLKSGDGNYLYFYKKPSAVLGTDTPDATITLGGGDADTKLTALGTFVGATYTNGTWSFNGLDNHFSQDTDTVVEALNELLGKIGTGAIDIYDDPTTTEPADLVAAVNTLASIIDAEVTRATTAEGNLSTALTAETTRATAAEGALSSAIDILNGNDTTTGSVAKSIKDAVEALDTTTDVGIASKSGKAVTIAGSISETDGIIGAGSGTAITLANVASTGAAEDVTTAAIDDGETEPTQIYAAGNVQGILEAIARDLNDLTTESAVTVEKLATATSGYFASYVVKQNGTQVGATIDIPKDYLVKGASVETVTTADVPYQGAEVGDKYIDFVINVRDASETAEHLYLPVDDLMAAISGGSNAETTVTVDSHNQITVTITKIAASKIAYDHSGTEETVQAALARIDGDATTAGSINKAKADVIGTNADTKTADTVYGAKAYADDKVTNLNTTSDVAIATVNGTTGAITITGSVKETSGVIGAGTADTVTITPITNSDIDALFT